MHARHCIVTPQFPGLYRNGGVGTHCFYLAELLCRQGAEITLLYTEDQLEDERASGARLPFGMRFVWTKKLPFVTGHFSTSFLDASEKCYRWLKEQRFDFIHFQDRGANGFRSVQAKRTGQAFEHSVLTCMLNGPNLWMRLGMKIDPYGSRDDILLDYCENYVAHHCDALLSPSRYALEWARDNWQLDDPGAEVLPYLFRAPFRALDPHECVDTLIFFGRLETRKGLELFLETLRDLFDKSITVHEVLFLGRRSVYPGGDSVEYIHSFLKRYLPTLRYRIEEFLNHAEALSMLRDIPNKLVVIPSWSETLGFAVIECMACNFNFIASRAGGIPELFEESDRLFDLSIAALSAKIEQALQNRLGPSVASWTADLAEVAWLDFFKKQAGNFESGFREEDFPPLVSICVPTYNSGHLLRETLDALRQQTYRSFEVLVGDDASTDPLAREEFDRLSSVYAGDQWSFIRSSQNTGPGAMRNRLVGASRGKYVLFVDSDNIPHPEMVDRLVQGALHAGLDSVGCYMKTEVRGKAPAGIDERISAWMPVGPALPSTFFGNMLGETNTLFRKEVFQKLGGFSEEPDYGHEDWELLIRLALHGYKHDIVPEFLLLYRIRRDSHGRSTPGIQNRLRAWRPLFEHLPKEKQFLASSLFVWEWRVDAHNHGGLNSANQGAIAAFEKSWLFQLHRFFRHPRKTALGWLTPAALSRRGAKGKEPRVPR